MTREEFREIVKKINGAWKNCIDSQGTFDVWYDCLSDLPFEVCAVAVVKLATTLTDYPRIAHIRKACTDLLTPQDAYMTPQEAWSIIERAISDGTYHAQERYDKLPPILKKCTSPDQIHSLATDENFNSGVESSNFFRTYNELLKKEKEFNQLNPQLQELIKGTGNSIGIGDKKSCVVGAIETV